MIVRRVQKVALVIALILLNRRAMTVTSAPPTRASRLPDASILQFLAMMAMRVLPTPAPLRQVAFMIRLQGFAVMAIPAQRTRVTRARDVSIPLLCAIPRRFVRLPHAIAQALAKSRTLLAAIFVRPTVTRPRMLRSLVVITAGNDDASSVLHLTQPLLSAPTPKRSVVPLPIMHGIRRIQRGSMTRPSVWLP